MMGTCTSCGTENVELNEQGLCANCAAKSGGESTGGDTGGDQAAA
jgi:NMD protein affecting ribosome stability and mRNA decay